MAPAKQIRNQVWKPVPVASKPVAKTWPISKATVSPASVVMDLACLAVATSPRKGDLEKSEFIVDDHSSTVAGEESDSEQSEHSSSVSVADSKDSAVVAATPESFSRDALLVFRHEPMPPPKDWMVLAVPRETKVLAQKTHRGAAPPKLPSPKANVVVGSKLRTPAAWSAARQCQEGEDPRAEMKRSSKSLLNKLTVEKFAEIYAKILALCTTCGQHIDVMAQQIFEKATLQHNFANMYSDLCGRLVSDLGEDSVGAQLQSQLMMLFHELFEVSWQPASACEEEDEDARSLRKKRAMGNLRFFGDLLVRGVIPSHQLFACTADLLKAPLVPDKLEACAILLTVTGPAFDRATWQQFSKLKALFWDIRGLTFNQEVPSRVRYLLRDVLELREAGWIDTKLATKSQSPKLLKEVAKEQAEGQGADSRPPLPSVPAFRPGANAAGWGSSQSAKTGSPKASSEQEAALMKAYADAKGVGPDSMAMENQVHHFACQDAMWQMPMVYVPMVAVPYSAMQGMPFVGQGACAQAMPVWQKPAATRAGTTASKMPPPAAGVAPKNRKMMVNKKIEKSVAAVEVELPAAAASSITG